MKSILSIIFTILCFTFSEVEIFSQTFDHIAAHLVYQSPEMDKVSVQENLIYKTSNDTTYNFDIYYPPGYVTKNDKPLPVVIFINAGFIGIPDANIYKDWAKVVAMNGMAAVNYQSYNHSKVQDAADIVDYLRKNAAKLRIDENRLGVWACSANVPIALPLVMQSNRSYIRCAAFYYGVMPNQAITRQDIHLQIVKSGSDTYNLNQGIDAFVKKAIDYELNLDFITYLEASHVFDIILDTERSRQIIQQTLTFFKNNLLGDLPPAGQHDHVLTAKSIRQQALNNNNLEALIIQIRAAYQQVKEQPEYIRFYNHIESSLIETGYELMNQNRHDKAIKILELATELYSTSPNAFDSLAEAHEKAGNIEKALQATQKAQALMANFQHPNQNFVNSLRQSIEDKLKRLKQ
ncbi:MAG: hypothetical protein SFU99_14580 [Saprospiraceae bacterium]|nr:hypothetical protein [Saprospiraceae bacterium]